VFRPGACKLIDATILTLQYNVSIRHDNRVPVSKKPGFFDRYSNLFSFFMPKKTCSLLFLLMNDAQMNDKESNEGERRSHSYLWEYLRKRH
jgi:hypothetical protein